MNMISDNRKFRMKCGAGILVFSVLSFSADESPAMNETNSSPYAGISGVNNDQ